MRRAVKCGVWLMYLGAAACSSNSGNEDARAADASVADASTVDALSLPDLSPALSTVRVHYPASGHTLTLRGSGAPLDWEQGVTLANSGDDTWTWSAIVDGELEFKPLLDGTTWARGPNYHLRAGANVDIYPHFLRNSGEVSQLFASFHSAALPDHDRIVWVYLPAVYLENPRAVLPVIYMHDGQNLFHGQQTLSSCSWEVDTTLNEAGEHGWCADGASCNGAGDCAGGGSCETLAEVIVVAPETSAQRLYELTPTWDGTLEECHAQTDHDCGGGSLYLQMLIDDLKPQVDNLLRTLPAREHTGLMGSSLGGLISAWGGIHYSNVFGLIGALSPSTWWNDRMIIGDVANIAPPPARALRVYLDSGNAGVQPDRNNDDAVNTRDLAQAYLDEGYVEGVDFHYLTQNGAEHSECWWQQRFPWAVHFLYGWRQP